MRKLSMVASSGKMTTLTRITFGVTGGPGEYPMENFGVDFAGGKRKAHPTSRSARAQRRRNMMAKRRKIASEAES